jgi:hypothetical protein
MAGLMRAKIAHRPSLPEMTANPCLIDIIPTAPCRCRIRRAMIPVQAD